jgi:hypothetical protein
VSNTEQVLRILDETLALRSPMDGSTEELYRVGVAMVERFTRIATIATEYKAGSIDCLIALLTAEPHFSYKYQPLLRGLAGSPLGTPNDYDGDDVVRFWRSWLDDNAKPEFAQVDWRASCPRVALANDAFVCPPVEELMRGFVEDDDPIVRYALARNQSLPESIWSLLSLSPEEDIRFELLLQRAHDPIVLRMFSEDRSDMIRAWVAWQPQTPTSALAHLAHDTAPKVRDALLNRELLPEPILSYLTECGDTVIEEKAAKKLRVRAHREELREAMLDRKVSAVEALLDKERGLAEATYAGNITPLHLATFPPAVETAYLICRALDQAGAESNAPDALGYTPCDLALRATQPIAAKMVKFLRCGSKEPVHTPPDAVVTRRPDESIDMLNARLEGMFDNSRLDLTAAIWRKLYDSLLDVLQRGGVSELQVTAWQPQALDSVPFILHTQGMREKLLSLASAADMKQAEAARSLFFEIASLPMDAQLAPHQMGRNPLLLWGGAVLDGVVAESELESAAKAARAVADKSVRALDMMTIIGHLVTLGHLIAQFVEEAPVESFVRFCSIAGYDFKIESRGRSVVEYTDPASRDAFPKGQNQSPTSIPVLESDQLALLPGRDAYLAYLKENGLSENAVLGILPEINAEQRRKVNQALMTALENGYEGLLKNVERASISNTNVLLAEINRRLIVRFTDHQVVAAKDVYAGVFPTNTFNAHVVRRADQPLVLVNTGAFELLEGAIVPFSLLKPGSARQQARVLARFVRQYCEERVLPQGDQFEDFQADEERSKLGVYLLTAAEDFVLAHEYGHLANGHVGNEAVELPLSDGRSIQVPSRQFNEEYEADRWGVHALLSSALNTGSNEEHLIICSGPLLFLSVAGLVEGYHAKLGLNQDTHPPAITRYTEIRTALAKSGFNRHTHVGASFRDFCAIVAVELDIRWSRDEGVTLAIDGIGGLVDEGLQDAVPILDQGKKQTAENVSKKMRPWWQYWREGD